MYVKEMHIEVDLSLQKIASNRTRKLLPQEIDWLLNKCMDRFIRTRARPKMMPNGAKTGGFEMIQDDVDAIKALIRPGIVLPAYRFDDRRVQAALPGDYMYLLQDESVIKRIPPGVSPSVTYGTQYLNTFPIYPSTLTKAPYYQHVQTLVNGTLAFDIQSYVANRQQQWGGFSSSDEIWGIISPMFNQLRDQGYNVYWEYYGGHFRPRSVIIVTPAAITGQTTIDGVSTAIIAGTAPLQFMDAPYEAEYQSNRLTPSNLVSSLLEVAFYGTQPEFPISEITDRSIYVYYRKDFIVSNVVISYIRKPRRISLILGVDCELSPEYHDMICDMTVEYTKAMIADPNWEVKLQDNMRRTNLDQ